MGILNKIIAYKRGEVAWRKTQFPEDFLQKSPLFKRSTLSLKEALQDESKLGVIAEFKRKSPSKGIINDTAKVSETTKGYIEAGASGLSILTDSEFFGGQNENLLIARRGMNSPILRKDFIIDEYQLLEAKAIGADVILLIAECLDKKRVLELSKFAKNLDLEVLMEVHSEVQLEKVNDYIDIVGVNNRNLDDFSVSIDTSLNLFDKIPDSFVKISESGLSDAEAIAKLKKAGFQGFLIGEYFMKQENPAEACRELIIEVEKRLLDRLFEIS